MCGSPIKETRRWNFKKNKTLQRKLKQGKRQLWGRGLNEREREKKSPVRILHYDVIWLQLTETNLHKKAKRYWLSSLLKRGGPNNYKRKLHYDIILLQLPVF